MTERPLPFDPASLTEGDELVFDDAAGVPEVPAATGPKRVKTGRKAAAAQAEAEIQAEIEIPTPAEPITSEAIAPVPAPSVIVAAPPLPKRLLIGALALSLFTSTVACVGLLVASRTIAHADDARAAAESQTAQLARLPATLEKLDHLVTQEQAALAALQQGRAAQPVSVGDLQRGLDGLRTAMAQRQPAQDQQIISTTKAGQSEIVERLAAIADIVDRIHDGQAKTPAAR